jgi:hypothetical protein
MLRAPVAGAHVDARAVSLGTLMVLRSLVERMRVTRAIDDVQWVLTTSGAFGSWTSTDSGSFC